MTLRTEPSDCDVRTRLAAFRVDLGTRYVTICVVSLIAGRSGGKRYTVRRMEGTSEQKKKAFSSIFTTESKSFIHVTHIAAMHIIFTRIGCILFMYDMYMCCLRHINDSVLSSLKMEGKRLLFKN
jgi:hypothetical protein